MVSQITWMGLFCLSEQFPFCEEVKSGLDGDMTLNPFIVSKRHESAFSTPDGEHSLTLADLAPPRKNHHQSTIVDHTKVSRRSVIYLSNPSHNSGISFEGQAHSWAEMTTGSD